MITAEQFAGLARREYLSAADYDQFLGFADKHCTPRMLRELLDSYSDLNPQIRRLTVKLLARKIAQGLLARPHRVTASDHACSPPH